ncbi:hypothetical protein [Frankia sp. QA3]|uniref:hypothetical protein n=1 Tax=Frankia sp. QA3 TaxID=710111 RepID=UPI0002FA32CE|nr:hypothetical protein [Frankia sp. QA3]
MARRARVTAGPGVFGQGEQDDAFLWAEFAGEQIPRGQLVSETHRVRPQTARPRLDGGSLLSATGGPQLASPRLSARWRCSAT